MVCIEIFVEYEDVVQIDENMSLMDFNMEYVVHHGLEGAGRVSETKEHHQGLIKPMISVKCCLPLVTLLHPNVLVTPLHIKLGKVLHTPKLIVKLRDQRKWIAILDHN